MDGRRTENIYTIFPAAVMQIVEYWLAVGGEPANKNGFSYLENVRFLTEILTFFKKGQYSMNCHLYTTAHNGHNTNTTHEQEVA